MRGESTILVARRGKPVSVPRPQGRVYSGEYRTGTCECGCSWGRHHLQIVIDARRLEDFGEEFVPGECLNCVECNGYKDRSKEEIPNG